MKKFYLQCCSVLKLWLVFILRMSSEFFHVFYKKNAKQFKSRQYHTFNKFKKQILTIEKSYWIQFQFISRNIDNHIQHTQFLL